MEKLKIFVVVLITTFLYSCGGGGGGGGGGTNNSGKYSISVDRSTLDFKLQRSLHSTTFPDITQTVTVSYKGEGVIVGYPVGIAQPSWLSQVYLTDLGGGKMSLRVAPSIGLASSPLSESTTLRVITGKADGSDVVYTDIKVNFALLDNLDIASTDDFTIGMSPDAQYQTNSIKFDVETWSKMWMITSDVDWLIFSSNQGVGNQLGPLNQVSVSVDLKKAPKKSATAHFTLSELGGSLSQTKTVELKVDGDRIWFDRPSLALSLFDGENTAKKTLKVFGNSIVDTNSLTIVSNVDWLSISKADGAIEISANRHALTSGMHLAQVSVSKNGVGVIAAPLTVGFYIHDGAYPADFTGAIGTSEQNISYLTQDPVRPLIYGVVGSTLKAYNFYTGKIEFESDVPLDLNKTHHFVVDSILPHYVSDDGSVFYLLDAIDEHAYTGGEKYVYHRYDIQNQTWLSDVAASNHAPKMFVDGVYLTHLDYKYQNPLTGAALKIGESCTDIDFEGQIDFVSLGSRSNSINNGSEFDFLRYSDFRLDLRKVRIQIFNEMGAVTCSSLPAPLLAGYTSTQHLNTVSRSGSQLLEGNNLFDIKSDTLISSAINLAIPEQLISLSQPTQLIYQKASLFDEAGHVFIGREVFTGFAYQPDFVTEYEADGSELRTIKLSLGSGGEIKRMMLSSDGLRVVSQVTAPNSFTESNIYSMAIR